MSIEKYVSKAGKAGEVYYLQHLHDCWNHPEYRRLNANEILYTPSEHVKEAVIAMLDKLNYYPEDASTDTEFLGKLAAYVGLPGRADSVTIGNGSMEIIDMIYKTFVNEGDDILVAMPEYSPYARRAKMFLANVVNVYPDDPDNFTYSAESYLSKVTPKTKLVIITRPNNPDGHMVSREMVEKVASSVDAMVVVDEAYYEFDKDPIEPYLDKYPNMIISHTFSKAMGLAAVRLGFAIASPEVIGYINQVRMPTNVNVLARAAAMALLDEPEVIEANAAKIRADRQWLYDEIAKIPGLRPVESHSNFVMIDCKNASKTATQIYEYLNSKGLRTRIFANSRGLEGDRYFRVTIGLHEDMEAVVREIRAFLGC